MTLVLSVQPYYSGIDDSLTNYPISPLITIDCEDPDQPALFLPLIEQHLKALLTDGHITTGMSVSACLYNEQCDQDIVIECWFSTHVANLHSETSNWW